MNNRKTVHSPKLELVCPNCGKFSVFREEQIVEGLFEVVGVRRVCSSCGVVLPDDWSVSAAASANAPLSAARASDNAALDALFGDASPSESRLPVLSDADSRRFCKYCRHYLRTPFLSHCLLQKCDTEPMGICEQFGLATDDHEQK